MAVSNRLKSSCRPRCAPPSGSAMISSTIPSVYKSCAVSFIMVQASPLREASFHKMLANPSGLNTEYTAFSSIRIWLATPSAARAFARNDGQYRDGQTAHLHQVAGDGLPLAALLGILTGVSTGGINKCDDGPPEFFRLLHHAQRLAVAFRSRHAKVAAQVFFQRRSFAVPQNRNGHPMESRDTAQNGRVLLALPVTALLKKVGKQVVDDFADMRAVRAARQKNSVLRRQ